MFERRLHDFRAHDKLGEKLCVVTQVDPDLTITSPLNIERKSQSAADLHVHIFPPMPIAKT